MNSTLKASQVKEQPSQYLNGKLGNNGHILFKANDRSYFALLKKEIHAVAVSIGLSEKKIHEIDIVVAELASNLVKHAGGGELLVKPFTDNKRKGIEIISVDNGAGISDVSRMISDGISTKSTLGLGLGAIRRLSDVFQIYSLKNWGTIILSRIFDKELPPYSRPSKTEIRSVVYAKPGEQACGDDFFSTESSHHIKLFLGDGLGHGPEAAHAVQQAGEAFLKADTEDPAEIIRIINLAVKKTRGLVGTVAVFDLKEKKWSICGVGNILTRISGPTISKSYMSYNGIIGLNVPRTLNAQEIPYEKNQHLLLCSDGVRTRWDLLKYTGIFRYDLSILAASITKDFARNTDDTSVVACKINI